MPSLSITPLRHASPQRIEYAQLHQLAVFVSLLIVATSLTGCGKELFKSLGEMARLRTELIKEFHDPGVNVVIQNSSVLGVTFINSKLNEQDGLKRMERAQQTALFISRHFAGIDQIERVWVTFIAHETHFIIVNYTRGIDTFLFDKKGTLLGPSSDYALRAESKADDEARADYSARRDETDVQITRLQLSGDLNNGIALVPHFSLRGNATTADHTTTPPSTIDFTFASYAREKVFKTNVSFVVIADGKSIYKSVSQNTSMTTEGGNEFLTQEIPFPQFLEMTRARQVSLKLADKQYRLTDRQLDGLREMASYATSTHP